MGVKMKGLLKGFRYISHIFEGDEKEPEMQIGLPTDVKHVAHIGWDGPSTTAPSWMNEFRSSPLSATSASADTATDIDAQPKCASAEFQPTASGDPPRPRSSRRKDSSTNADSPGRESTRPHRRRPSSGAAPLDAPSEGSRHSRRNRSGGSGAEGPDSPPSLKQDPPGLPKQTRRRRTKDSPSTSGGSSRPARRAVEGGGAEPPPVVPPAAAVIPEEGVF